MRSLDYFYDEYLDIEAASEAFLSQSLHPRGPQMLFDIVEKLGLPAESSVLDVGCGEGAFSVELAQRFRFNVLGLDPIPRHMAIATEALQKASAQDASLRDLVHFALGQAEAIPTRDNCVDLIWCRDVLVHVEHLDQAFSEFRRVLNKTGRILILHSFATNLLESREAEWLWSTMRVVPSNTSPQYFEQALSGANLQIETCTDLKSEWKEFAEEQTGKNSKKLLYAARLQRDPGFYISKFGQEAYDIMLGDCFWHIYQMIGKLSYRVYLLRAE
jgi:ubiquinone/menaquinone biosynthesis C-methylase UbiE